LSSSSSSRFSDVTATRVTTVTSTSVKKVGGT
jgi:hypothetical protein